MSQDFRPGDFLIFQLEAGYALLRLLGIDNEGDDRIWHVAGYADFYPDVDAAEAAISNHRALKISSEHIALTTRAFESTQVARLGNSPLDAHESEPVETFRSDPERRPSDRSVRLMLGLR